MQAPAEVHRFTSGVALSGATAPSYTTPPTAVADNGAKYYVTVTNACGTLTSASATLTVTASGDSTPPTVTLTAPTAGATVTGAITLAVAAADNLGVTRVEYHVDGLLVATATVAPWSASFATTTLTNATHGLIAKAYDAAGNVGTSAMLSFFVSNPTTQTLTWKQSMVYGFGQLLSEETAAGPTYLQGDQLNSPNYLTNAAGVVVGRSKNLPFGERFGNIGSTSLRRFTNHEDQPGSAIYMQARTYLPAYGKFAQVDPAYDQTKDDPESWNLYNYCTNNPVTNIDPDGRMESSTWGGVGGQPGGTGETGGMASGFDYFGVEYSGQNDWKLHLRDGWSNFMLRTDARYYDLVYERGEFAPTPIEATRPLAQTSDSAGQKVLKAWAAETDPVAASLMVNTWDKKGSVFGMVGEDHGVGHVAIADPSSGAMLLSQFPANGKPGGPNVTKDAQETKREEKRGPNHSFMVDVKDRGAFARQALSEAGKKMWTPMGVFGTQCAVSSTKSLFAGGTGAVDRTPFRWPGSLTRRLDGLACAQGSGVTRAEQNLVISIYGN